MISGLTVEFQHVGPETAKAREPNATVLVRGKFRSPWVAAAAEEDYSA